MRRVKYHASVGELYISDLDGEQAWVAGEYGRFHLNIDGVDLCSDVKQAANIHLRDFVLLRKTLGNVRFHRIESSIVDLSEDDVEQLTGGGAK